MNTKAVNTFVFEILYRRVVWSFFKLLESAVINFYIIYFIHDVVINQK
jgi:hypothetical protein